MVAVFISYARSDRDFAKRIAGQLTRAGHSVWWDWNLIAGEQFRATITKKLDEADKVVVLWTAHSASSAFVVDEATRAREAGKLVPVSVSGSKPSLGFGDLHTIDFVDEEISMQRICAALEGRVYTVFVPNTGGRRSPPVIYVVLGAAAAVGALTLLAFSNIHSSHKSSHIPIIPQATPSFSCEKYAVLPESDRVPQSDILCYDKDASDADYKMGILYWIIINKMSANDAEKLVHQQREWIKERNQNCPVSDNDLMTPDGKVKLPFLAQKAHCLKLEAEKRYAELQRQADLIGSRGDQAQNSTGVMGSSVQKRTEP